jgi:hypothetical protein
MRRSPNFYPRSRRLTMTLRSQARVFCNYEVSKCLKLNSSL